MQCTGLFLTAVLGILALSHTAAAQLPTCTDIPFEACGGDMTGTWAYQSVVCMDPPDPTAMFPGCVGIESQWDGAVAGSTVFTAEGTFAEQLVRSMAFMMAIPSTCLPPGLTCDDMTQTEGMSFSTGEHCIVTVVSAERDDETGTYTVDGARATLVNEVDGDVDIGSFCIDGDEMYVRVEGDSGLTAIIRHSRVR